MGQIAGAGKFCDATLPFAAAGLQGSPERIVQSSGADAIREGNVMLIRYLANLSRGRLVLWCYFIWYVVVLVRYFDASLRLWLTSLGLSVIIGMALFVSTAKTGATRVKLEPWQVFRLFLMPFCVSSFSALVKDRDFVLFFSHKPLEILLGAGLCALLCATVFLVKRCARPQKSAGGETA